MEMKWLETLIDSGFISLLIIICFLIVSVLFFKKMKMLRNAKSTIPSFSVKIRGSLKRKEIGQAIEICMAEKSPLANIVRRGLKKYKFGRARVIEEIEAAGRQEVRILESGLSLIATVSGTAPMLGFLGTVLGMGSLLRTIKELQGSATIGDFAGGIWQVLVSSALGLLAGIYAVTIYNYLVNRIGLTAIDLERFAMEIFDTADDSEKENIKEEAEGSSL
jgi:biopolymer transport protein ExbB